MWFIKNRGRVFFLILLKTLLFIIGINIFLTSLFTVIKLELKKNNLESEINLNIKKFKYDQLDQFDSDIY